MTLEEARSLKLGQSKVMRNGHTATCTAYRGARDADFTFEDGSVTTGKAWAQFDKGTLKPPSVKRQNPIRVNQAREKYVGMQKTCKNGFEDGTTVGDIRSGDFNNGNVTHPLYPSRKGKAYGKKIRIGCVDRRQMAYNCRLANYYCACAKCGLEDIMDWREIHAHNMAHSIPRETLAYEGAVILDTPLQEPKGA